MDAVTELEWERDVADVTRFLLDLHDDGVVDKAFVGAVRGLMHGDRRYRPQAVAQALVSYLVNQRRDRVSDPIAYITRTIAAQQRRIYGKTRKHQ